MNDNNNTLINKIIQIIGFNRRILVCFSGGLDSTVLLHSLVTLRKTIMPNLILRAIHINHGLNNKSNNWSIHCKNICSDFQVKFYSKHININKKKQGIESAARNARYKEFSKILLPEEIIVTGHHLYDQAETFLLALKRGSGPSGLSSMPVSIPFASSYLIRPLLSISIKQLIIYARKHSLIWIEDDSNYNQRYDRNFLRLTIMPYFNKRWPYFLQTVARSASLCAEQESLLNELLKDDLSKLITLDGTLLINTLKDYSVIKRNAILRRWLGLYKILMPSRVQLKQIWQDVICAKPDAEPKFILSNNIIRRFKNQLWLLPKFSDLTKIFLTWIIPNELKLPDNLGTLVITDYGNSFRAPFSYENVTIRFGLTGRIKIIGREHTRHSKKLWQELGIAPWLRKRIPLIYYNDKLITAVGIFITKEGQYIQGKSKLIVQVKNPYCYKPKINK
ncbi:MAG: tRNA lysidine(34) synthetase TilS [Arsenophonus endosymbiont of Ceratovacuna japonica]